MADRDHVRDLLQRCRGGGDGADALADAERLVGYAVDQLEQLDLRLRMHAEAICAGASPGYLEADANIAVKRVGAILELLRGPTGGSQ